MIGFTAVDGAHAAVAVAQPLEALGHAQADLLAVRAVRAARRVAACDVRQQLGRCAEHLFVAAYRCAGERSDSESSRDAAQYVPRRGRVFLLFAPYHLHVLALQSEDIFAR